MPMIPPIIALQTTKAIATAILNKLGILFAKFKYFLDNRISSIIERNANTIKIDTTAIIKFEKTNEDNKAKVKLAPKTIMFTHINIFSFRIAL